MKKIIQSIKNTPQESEYTLNDGILFRNDRIVVAPTLRSRILKELPETHLGTTKMKQLVHRWPGIDREIEKLALPELCSCEVQSSKGPHPPLGSTAT